LKPGFLAKGSEESRLSLIGVTNPAVMSGDIIKRFARADDPFRYAGLSPDWTAWGGGPHASMTADRICFG